MRFSLLLVASFVLSALGCGSKYTTVPVSGTVTFNGEPLANASVLTQPVSNSAESPGPGSFGHTDAQGRFTLELQVDESIMGAIPGTCVIMITEKGQVSDPSSDEIPRSAYRSRIPELYRNGTYTQEIPAEGTDAFDIAIDTKKRR